MRGIISIRKNAGFPRFINVVNISKTLLLTSNKMFK